MNVLTVGVTTRDVEALSDGRAIWYDARIDGEPIFGISDDITCFAPLLASASAPGNDFFRTCSCRNHGCGGYFRGTDVEVSNEEVRWQSRKTGDETLQFRFAHEAYRRTVEAVRRETTELLGDPSHLYLFSWDEDAELFGLDRLADQMGAAKMIAANRGDERYAEKLVYAASKHLQGYCEWDLVEVSDLMRRQGWDMSTESSLSIAGDIRPGVAAVIEPPIR